MSVLLFLLGMFVLGLRDKERKRKKIEGLEPALFFKHYTVSHQ